MASAERGLALNSIDAYRRDLACFAAHLAPSCTDLVVADSESIRGFMAAQSRSGIAARTASRRLSCLRQFYRFLLTDGRRDDDPTAPVDSPTLPRTLPGVLSEEEVERLLTVACPQDDTTEASAKREADGLRLRAMIELLYGSGLRVSELVSLPLQAVTAENTNPAGTRQGRQGAPGPARDTSPSRARCLSGGARSPPGPRRAVALAVPLPRRERPPHAASSCAVAQGAGAGRRDRAQPGLAARAASRLRQPFARQWCGPEGGAEDARPCRHRDDRNLHPCPRRAAQAPGRSKASSGRRGPHGPHGLGQVGAGGNACAGRCDSGAYQGSRLSVRGPLY